MQDILGASKLNSNQHLLKRINNVIVADFEATWLGEFFLSVLIDDILENDESIAFCEKKIMKEIFKKQIKMLTMNFCQGPEICKK